MRSLNVELDARKINYDSLKKFGFIKEKEKYIYSRSIINNEYLVIIEIQNNEVISKIIDLAFNEEYILTDISNVVGEYNYYIKTEYEKVIYDFIQKCTICEEIYKFNQTKQIINYIKNKYQDDLEFLWKSSPKSAIWRNKKNNKWYGIVMTIKANKLGIDLDKDVEIIDLRYQKDKIVDIIDSKKIFGGFHMNKKSWITIILDGSITSLELFKLIDNSYNISLNN